MTPIEKVAVFLMLIGREKGQSVIALLDNREITAVVSAMRKLTTVSSNVQKSIWAEFEELGYEDVMKPADTVTIIRFMFHGSNISDKNW